MTKKRLQDLKPGDIIAMEPALGSSQNAAAWNMPDYIDNTNSVSL